MMACHNCDQKRKKFTIGSLRTAGLVLASFFLLGLTVPALAGAPATTPFKGTATTTDTPIGGDPGNDKVAFAKITGTGEATPIGTFTLYEDSILDLRTFQFVGIITWTVANGDQLIGTTIGALTPTGISGTTTFTGGTGAYKNATGTVKFNGVNQGTAEAPLFAVTYDGEISLLPPGNP